jgi:hypothetical protein
MTGHTGHAHPALFTPASAEAPASPERDAGYGALTRGG